MKNAILATAKKLTTWTRRWWWLVLIAAGVVVLLSVGIAVSLLQLSQTAPLMLQADALSAGDMRVARQREIVQLQADNLSKIWTTIVQAVVGVVLAVGAVATWRNLRVAQEVQITNRFTQAISQLGAIEDGKPNLEVRLGGIYALERIARDSPRDHWTIMEVLTAYVRENARWTEPTSPDGVVSSPEDVRLEQPQQLEAVPPRRLRTDIQAILTVLGRRSLPLHQREPAPLDLRDTDLRQADLWRAHLEEAYLRRAHLDWAHLRRIRLDRADLTGAHLKQVDLSLAHLEGASLDDADLSTAKNLTEDQVKSARSLKGARLPPHLTHLEEPANEPAGIAPVPPSTGPAHSVSEAAQTRPAAHLP